VSLDRDYTYNLTWSKCAKAAIPALIKALADSDVEVRKEVINTLDSIGESADGVIPAFIAALKDEDYDVRGHAVNALGSRENDAREAVPALLALIEDQKATDRRSAILLALQRIKPPAKQIVGAARRGYETTDDRWARRAAADLIKAYGKETVGPLVAALNDARDVASQKVLVSMLGDLGPDAEDAVPVLQELGSNTDNSEVAAIVKFAIEGICDKRPKTGKAPLTPLGPTGADKP
jgi:HEAT repeat protein